jgi:hypothetical protein
MVNFTVSELPSLPFTVTPPGPGPLVVENMPEVMVTEPVESVVPLEVVPPGQVTCTPTFGTGPPGGGTGQVTVTVTLSTCPLSPFKICAGPVTVIVRLLAGQLAPASPGIALAGQPASGTRASQVADTSRAAHHEERRRDPSLPIKDFKGNLLPWH